jgi:CheY-like chemotaxis protein
MDNQKLKILVVEDEQSLRDAINIKLNSLGIEAVSFESGQKAIDYLMGLSAVDKLPDIIWLDYYVKDLDGLGFMHELKSYNNIANIPVIVVSNSAGPEKVQRMLDMGAKKYILKAENKLDDIVSTVLELAKK